MKDFEWIDISIGYQAEMTASEACEKATGNRKNRRNLSMRVISQSGTHVGAPLPLQKTGMGIDNMSFAPTVGLAKIIEIHDRHMVRLEELKQHRIFPHDRILLKTTTLGHECSRSDHAFSMERDAASWLVERRISTLGIDALSMSGSQGNGIESRRILSQAGIWVIEGLDLARVHSGEYMLICLPLKIFNGDTAPARAILQRVR